MPRAEFPEDVDLTYERSPFPEVIVYPRDEHGNVAIIVDTSDSYKIIYASPARWESIIAAIRASLEEDKP